MDLSNDPSQSKELQHVEIQKMVVDICMFFFAEILFLFFPLKTRSFLWLQLKTACLMCQASPGVEN